MKKTLEQYGLPLLLAIGILLAGEPVFAQERRAAGEIVSPAQFGTRLQGNDRQLVSIEQLFTRMEAAKVTADKEKYSDDLSDALAAYAKAIMESFDTANKQAELAAKSEGKGGSTALLKPFEDLAVKHENRLKQLDERAQKIMGSPKSSSISEPAEGGRVAGGWPMLEKISDFFISPARAAIALSVYTACHQNNPPLCTQYTAWGITQTQAAWVIFNACWNNLEGTRPKWWRAILRASCTTGLVVRLA
jgi:hypothetical protein